MSEGGFVEGLPEQNRPNERAREGEREVLSRACPSKTDRTTERPPNERNAYAGWLASLSRWRKKSHITVALIFQIDLIAFLFNLCFNAGWVFDVNSFFDGIAFQKSVNCNA